MIRENKEDIKYFAPAVKVVELSCQRICETSNVSPKGSFGLGSRRMEEEDI